MENKKYNQFKAIKSISKASLISLFRDPSTVVFSILFPIIFIVVFGFLGGGGSVLEVAVSVPRFHAGRLGQIAAP